MTYRTRSLTIASVLALMAFVLTILYVSGYKKNVKRQGANTIVYVARKDIQAGTPSAELVHAKLLKTVEVPRSEVVSGFVGTPAQISGLVVAQPIYAGEQLTLKRFATKGEEGVPSQIAGKSRAIQLPGDKNQLLMGTLKAGDHVDVVSSLHVTVKNAAGDQTDRTVGKVVLRGLLVLQTSALASGSALHHSNGDGYVLLSLTDVQARDSKPSVETPESVVLDDLSPAARSRVLNGIPAGGK
jgi:Flp pilus assembly protein CpaB